MFNNLINFIPEEVYSWKSSNDIIGLSKREAEEKAKKKAESDEYGFLDNADENAKKVIKGMFENVAGERKVVVEFK